MSYITGIRNELEYIQVENLDPDFAEENDINKLVSFLEVLEKNHPEAVREAEHIVSGSPCMNIYTSDGRTLDVYPVSKEELIHYYSVYGRADISRLADEILDYFHQHDCSLFSDKTGVLWSIPDNLENSARTIQPLTPASLAAAMRDWESYRADDIYSRTDEEVSCLSLEEEKEARRLEVLSESFSSLFKSCSSGLKLADAKDVEAFLNSSPDPGTHISSSAVRECFDLLKGEDVFLYMTPNGSIAIPPEGGMFDLQNDDSRATGIFKTPLKLEKEFLEHLKACGEYSPSAPVWKELKRCIRVNKMLNDRKKFRSENDFER